MWWIYFDDFKWEIVSKANRVFKIWIFIHLPLHMLYLFFSICVVDIVRTHPDYPSRDEVVRFLSVGGLIFVFNAAMKLLNSWSVKQHFDYYNITIYLSRFLNGIILFLMLMTPSFGSLSLLLTMMGFCLFQGNRNDIDVLIVIYICSYC